MKIIKITVCLSAILTCFAACNKSDGLPLPTSRGANTFGCKINGIKYIPDKYEPSVSIYPVIGGFYNVGGDIGVYIQTSRYDSFLDIYIKKVDSTGIYYLNKDTWPMPYATWPDNYGYYAQWNGSSTIDYYTNIKYTGKVTLTVADKTTRIVAGTFEFIGYNPVTKDSIRITDGRFDVKN